MSCSTRFETAKAFSGGVCIYEITYPSGCWTVTSIKDLSKYEFEEEHLIQPYSIYKVTDVLQDPAGVMYKGAKF
jgi:hypothetical protein